MGWLDRFRLRKPVEETPPETPAEAAAPALPPVTETPAAPAPPAPPPALTPPPFLSEPPAALPAEPAPAPAPPVSLLNRFKAGLSRTRNAMVSKVRGVFSRHRNITEALWEDLLDALLEADVGHETAQMLVDRTRALVRESRITEPKEVEAALQEAVRETVTAHRPAPLEGRRVLLVLGVNGVGKTTTIAKLSHYFSQKGERVLVAAADTFRAGAIEQLRLWSERVGVDFVPSTEGQDPSAVVYQALARFHKEGQDVLIVDTAGRLHTRAPLMEELKKMHRVAGKQAQDLPIRTLLVLDAHTGQNAIRQAEAFKEACQVEELVLTKLDGTPKGGAVVAICHKLGLPVAWVGLGEKLEDLRPFDGERFSQALFEGLGESPEEEEA